ncbi:MAG: hypothetical protein ACF8NJ_00825 [Phycisphaerales bacterium JB038]
MQPSNTMYQSKIKSLIGDACDPRHVEAHMRAENGTLDGLSPTTFMIEAHKAAWEALAQRGSFNERLAQSYGL